MVLIRFVCMTWYCIKALFIRLSRLHQNQEGILQVLIYYVRVSYLNNVQVCCVCVCGWCEKVPARAQVHTPTC